MGLERGFCLFWADNGVVIWIIGVLFGARWATVMGFLALG